MASNLVGQQRYDEIRRQFIVFASRKATRRHDSTPEKPTKWHPGGVIDPRSGAPFSPAGAWEFIVELLASGHPLEEIILEKPPGKKGYVLKHPGAAGRADIYIKLQLGSGYVHGRSFHESIYPSARSEP